MISMSPRGTFFLAWRGNLGQRSALKEEEKSELGKGNRKQSFERRREGRIMKGRARAVLRKDKRTLLFERGNSLGMQNGLIFAPPEQANPFGLIVTPSFICDGHWIWMKSSARIPAIFAWSMLTCTHFLCRQCLVPRSAYVGSYGACGNSIIKVDTTTKE